MSAKNAYIVFTDLKGFSKLSEPENIIFYNQVLNDLSHEILPYKSAALIWNTWGDALLAIFEDEEQVVNLMFTYRDFFSTYNWKKIT